MVKHISISNTGDKKSTLRDYEMFLGYLSGCSNSPWGQWQVEETGPGRQRCEQSPLSTAQPRRLE